MPFKDNICTQLQRPEYVPILKDNDIYYGGSQMWFSKQNRHNMDYILHNYGCGTVAIADLLLYLALQNKAYQTSVTASVLNENHVIQFTDYMSYLRFIHTEYTKTLRYLAVLGPVAAHAINTYSKDYGLDLRASWKWRLNYYEMYDLIEKILGKDIPVILSIGPNTPKLWGKMGIPFYNLKEIDYQELSESSTDELVTSSKPYYYPIAQQNINSHYVTVTALIKDQVTERIMLRISSWGTEYYINYEEYWDYVDNIGGTFTSSVISITT